jgi:preprotein translocase subunit YajC
MYGLRDLVAANSIHNLGAFWQAQGGGAGGALMWLPLLFIFGIFYFLLIMPQQRRQKQWQAMLSALKTGDKVVTSGGMRGAIISMKDEAVILRVPPDNLRIEVQRSAVVQVASEEKNS